MDRKFIFVFFIEAMFPALFWKHNKLNVTLHANVWKTKKSLQSIITGNHMISVLFVEKSTRKCFRDQQNCRSQLDKRNVRNNLQMHIYSKLQQTFLPSNWPQEIFQKWSLLLCSFIGFLVPGKKRLSWATQSYTRKLTYYSNAIHNEDIFFTCNRLKRKGLSVFSAAHDH